MKGTALTMALGTMCVLTIIATSASATTNVVKGTFTTQVSGSDAPGVNVVSEGGGQIQYLRLKTFHYPDYTADPMHQDIQGFAFSYDPTITSVEDHTDEDDNSYRYSFWGSPTDPYPGTILERIYRLTNTFTAELGNTLDGMPSVTSFPIPPGSVPPQFARYLQPGPFTQSDEQDIIEHANTLVAGCTKEYQAVMRIIDWCVDNLTYTSNPPQRDALWILQDPTHRAQCDGYSHMAIALAKAVGIPARFVGGYSISEQYFIPGPSGGWWFNHGQGTHGWLEVYYPDAGWVPYDAQGQYQYVDTHVYKGCIGIDTDNRRPAECSYAYWGSPPTIAWANTWNSGVNWDSNGLQYCCTYETPVKQAFADQVVDIIVGVQQTAKMSGADLVFASLMPNPSGVV